MANEYTVTKIIKKFDVYGNEFEVTKTVNKSNNESIAMGIYDDVVNEVKSEKQACEDSDKQYKITSVIVCVYLDYSDKKMRKKGLSCTSVFFNTCYME